MAKKKTGTKAKPRATRPTNLDLFCWYIHPRRVGQLVGSSVPTHIGNLATLSGLSGPMVANHYEAILKEALLKWLRKYPVDPIERQLLHETLAIGSLFTCYRNYYFRNKQPMTRGKIPKGLSLAYTKIAIGTKKYELQITYDRNDLWTTSAKAKCSGQKTMMVMGYVEAFKGGIIYARPHVIADVTKNPKARNDCRWPRDHYGEIWPASVDTFSKVRLQPIPRSLTPLSKLSEASVKAALAEIIGEPDIPKDWGGEESDLFTTRLHVNGAQTSAAFLLKGPANFKPMTFAALGKNGDQIERLYKSPADLLVLQHCHTITSPVRSLMRAFATQLNNPRACLILDGYETLRLLKAYSKCGLRPAKPIKPPVPVLCATLKSIMEDHPFSF